MIEPIYPEFNLDLMKSGHFMLVCNKGGFIGNQIERAQLDRGFTKDHAKFIHVDVLMGGPYAVRVNPPKTEVIDITKQYAGRYVRIVKYLADDYDDKRHATAKWAATHCNMMYDKLGVLKFRIPFLPNPSGLYFCSENALWALQKTYCFALGIKPGECMPAHFNIEQCFSVHWEGFIPVGYIYNKQICNRCHLPLIKH